MLDLRQGDKWLGSDILKHGLGDYERTFVIRDARTRAFQSQRSLYFRNRRRNGARIYGRYARCIDFLRPNMVLNVILTE